jgi:hemolysin activation/secretion protein
MANRSNLFRVLCILLVAGLAAVSAVAQVPITVPGQIERQFQTLPLPRSQAGSFQMPVPVQTVPPGVEGVRFRIRGLALDDMSVYSEGAWRPEYMKLFGREVSLAEIYAFANTLTLRYRNDGYLLSQVIVPAQTVEDGFVRLQAVEGYIAQVRFDGAASNALMRAQAERIKAERPLTAGSLERMLLLMNDQPGAFARAVLVPSTTQQGASDLVIQLTRQPVSAGVSLDNRGGRALGPKRATLDVEQRGLLGWGDRTGLRYVAAQSGEMKYLSFAHEQALGSDGSRAGLSWNRVRSQPDTASSFIPLDIETQSDSAALTLSQAALRRRNENVNLREAFAAHNGSTSLFGVRETQDRLRVLRLGLSWDVADAARGVNIVDVELGRGLQGAGASKAGAADLSRTNGKPAFTKLGLYAARLQAFDAFWPQWSLLGAFNAQYAFDDLLAPELFSFGGEQFGRGYDPSELVGDHGAALKLEVRYTLGSEGGGSDLKLGATIYGFFDAGMVRQRSPAGTSASASATSTGLGVRFDVDRPLTGYIEAAKPLTRDVAAEGNGKWRLYTGLSLRY